MALQYQDFLLEEFRSRRSRNPHYSLRAFARDLGMPASKLSQNLRGLCGISVAKAEKIAAKLQMRDDEKHLFLALVESQHARSRVARQQAHASLQKIREEKIDEMNLETFSSIRDWYHMAILEMVDIKGFRPDPEWIAAKLTLPVEVVKEAVERLQTIGLLAIENGVWRQTHQELELPSGIPSRTIREHHKQILTKAIMAIDQTAVERREYSTQTFAFDHRNLNEVKTLVREFQRKLGRLSHQGNKDSVYIMAMQLFPVVEAEE
ncbi:MAG: DUF4423 domain-containing protein [Bdellovibrionales bacterium]|nr:DUF4423 domain-containing protein [Bdellovibrionales bacterium]